MNCPNCERYRLAMENAKTILEFGIGNQPVTAAIGTLQEALAPTPEELGEQPLPFEGAPV